MKTAWILVAVIALSALVPITTAQAPTPVEKCTKQCNPKDPDVNGPDIKKGDQPVTAVLYGHFEDLLNLIPLNTQAPDPAYEHDLNGGFLMPILDTNDPVCVPPGSPTCLQFHFKNNQFQMYFSPGMVEYLPEGWRTHQEPGLSADVKVQGSEIYLYWYLSAHSVPGWNTGSGQGALVKVGAMPQVAVYARMETGRFPFRGQLLAESVDFDNCQVALCTERQNMVTNPSSSADVYEFKVPLKMTADSKNILPSDEIKNGIIVYVNPYQIKDDKEKGHQAGQNEWRLRTGDKFKPRLVIPAERVMETKYSELSIFDERLFVRWSFVSAWGSYDMRDQALVLKSTGPNPIDSKAVELIIIKRSIDHDGHFKPVNATWAIDFHKFPLADGEYELTASIPNLQETYLLEQKFNFTVKNGRPIVKQIGAVRGAGGGGAFQGPGGEAPAVDMLLLLGSVAAVIAVSARRRNE